jgi:hypothetical protein
MSSPCLYAQQETLINEYEPILVPSVLPPAPGETLQILQLYVIQILHYCYQYKL